MIEKMIGKKGLNLALGIVLLASLIVFSQDASASRLREFSQLQFGGDLSLNSTTLSIMTANTSRMYFTADGLIGIGTVNPSAALEVVGNFSIPGTLFVDNESGRVGIGTSSPQTELEVAGTINASAIQIGQSAVQVEAAAFKIGNYSSEYATSGFDRENISDYLGGADVNASLIRVGNLSSVFEAAFDLANYSSEYATSGWKVANYSAEYASSGWQKANYSAEYAASGFDRENISDYLGGENISIFNLANYSAEYATSGFDNENFTNLKPFDLTNYSAEYAASGWDKENYSVEYASSGWKIANLTSYYANNNLVIGAGFGSGGSTFETDGDIFVGGNLHIIGNITNTEISNLNINGSMFPSLDDMFDVGNGSLQWDDGNFSGTLEAGTLSDGSGASITGGVVNAPTVQVSGSNVQVEAAAFKIANYSAEYAASGWDKENYSAEYSTSGFDNDNFTARYDARDDRFGIANYSAEYAASGFDNENFTARLSAENTSLWNRSGNDIFNADFGGNVGIGTIAPKQTLHVNGTGFLVTNTTGSANVFVFNATTGRVGIGNTIPNNTLDVSGDANITGTLWAGTLNITGVSFTGGDVDAAGSLRVAGGANISGDLGVLGNIYGEIPDGFKIANITSYLGDGGNGSILRNGTIGAAIDNTTINRSVDLGDYQLKADNTSLWNRSGNDIFNADFGGNVGIGTTSPGMKLVVAGNANVSQNLTVNNSVLFVDGTSGRVGIGTNNPTRVLDVFDNSVGNITYPIRISNVDDTNPNTAVGLLFGSGGSLVGTSRGKGAIIYQKGDAGGWNRGDFHILQSSAGDSNPANLSHRVVTIKNSGNVGIGTTAPGYKLDVIGDVNASNYYINGSSIFEILDNGTINRSLDLSNYYTQAEADAADGGGDTDLLAIANVSMLDNSTIVRMNTTNVGKVNITGNFSVGTSDFFVDDTSGNIGIGTTGPESILHIYEASDHVTGRFETADSGSIALFKLKTPAGSANIEFGRVGDEFGIYSDTLSKQVFTVDTSNGNVGIGTTAPGRKLEVSGSMNSTQLNVSGTTNLAYDSGNVGIGTADPSSTLEVEGNMTVTDTNSTVGNFSIIQYNSTCSGFRFGATGGLILSCE